MARIVPYVFIVLGFIIAVSGQFVQGKISDRVTHLKLKAEDVMKHTPPKVKADILAAEDRSLVIVIESENLIPFSSRWLIVTENDHVISGVMLGNVEFHPTKENRKWQYKQQVNKAEIVNDFIELRLDYVSLYSAELNHPPALKGKVVRKFKLIDGIPRPIN